MDRLLSMRVFAKVVDEGSFSGAARALDMSAPVVTRLVADLEDHLGTRLLQRTTRRLSLTDAGQAYLQRVRHILQDIEEAHELTRTSTTEPAGLVRIHAPPIVASNVLAPLLAEFRRQYPRITLDIDVEVTGELAVEDYDLTLLLADAGFDADIVARKVIESDVVLVASPDYVKRHGLPQSPEELATHACMKPRVALGWRRGWRLWRCGLPEDAVEVEVTPALQANHIETLLRATLDGAGICAVALPLAAPLLENGDLVRVLPGWTSGRVAIWAALPSRKYIPQRTRLLLDAIVERTQAHMIALDQSACSEAPVVTSAVA